MSEYDPGDELEWRKPTPRERLERVRMWIGDYLIHKFTARDREAERVAAEHRESAAELADDIIQACMDRAEEFYPEGGVRQFRATFMTAEPSEEPLMQVDVFGEGEASISFGAYGYEFTRDHDGSRLAYHWIKPQGEREHPFVQRVTDFFDPVHFLDAGEAAMEYGMRIDVEPLDITSH